MAGLLAADHEAVSHHVLSNILVAYGCLLRTDADSLASLVKTHIAHDGGNDRISVQTACFLHILAAQIHDLVAVYLVAELVNRKTSVSVAVVSKSYVKSVVENELLQCIDMCGAAVSIDVETVRCVVDNIDLSTQSFVNRPCDIP